MHRTLVALLLLVLAAPAAGQGAGSVVVIIHIDDVVTRGTSLHVQDAIGEAESRGAPLVIELDTPGGLVDATLDIKKSVERAQVPVLTFVGPRGAFALSAGTFIFLMGSPNGMAPGTQIGSAQPIEVSPGGSARNTSAKVENALIAQMRSIAERTGRDADVAERFITENLNLLPDAAHDEGMADLLVDDVESFVRAVHGREAIVGDGTVTLDTREASIVYFDRGLLASVVDLLGNPQVAFLLFIIGMYALIFGLAAPGTFVPETIGALMLLLGLIGLGLFETSTAGILLLILAGVFFVSELFAPTHGVLTVAGVITLFFAAVFLVDEPLLPRSFLQQFFIIGVVAAVASGGVALGAVMLVVRARKRPVAQSLIGLPAEVVEPLTPEGMVRLRGELWKARSESGAVAPGEQVVVVARDGLMLTVEKRAPEETVTRPARGT